MIASTMDILVGCSIVVACATTVLLVFAIGLLISLKRMTNKINKLLRFFNLELKIMAPILLGKKIISAILGIKNDSLKFSKNKRTSVKISKILKYTTWIGIGLTLWGIFRKKD